MSMEREIDITPLTGVLERERNSQLGWKRAVAELVDNAFDADALQVRIEFAAKRFSIVDDGCGAKDIQAMLRFGDHRRQKRETLGRYGVGTKMAAVWAWGRTTIATNRDGKISVARVDWADVERRGDWKVGSSELEATPTACKANGLPTEHGTLISFDGHSRNLPGPDEIVAQLSYKFAPAIAQGRQIRVKHQRRKAEMVVPEFRPPLVEHRIDKEIEVDGKRARVWAGVVPSSQTNPLPGFTFVHRHRVLTTNTNGCGEHVAERFFGWVELIGDGWKLSVTKDGISEGEDELYAALESLCCEQLARASAEARDVELAGLEESLSTAMTDALCEQKKRKAKRRPKQNDTGAVKPKDTDAKHEKASDTQPGPNTILGPCPEEGKGTRRIGDKIKVSFSNEQGKGVIGRVDANDKCVSVTLYLEHPAVKWAAEDRNNQGLSLLTAALVAMFAATEGSEKVKQRLFPFAKDFEGGTREQLLIALSAYTRYVKDKCDHDTPVPAT